MRKAMAVLSALVASAIPWSGEPMAAAQSGGAGTWVDPRTGLMWNLADNGEDIDWDGALAYCRRMARGGFDDWDLPSLDELHTLFEPADTLPPQGRRIVEPIELSSLRVWSSAQPDPDSAISFFFYADGRPGTMKKRNQILARALCVRRPEGASAAGVAEVLELVRLKEERWRLLRAQAELARREVDAQTVARFSDSGRGTVLDSTTGLEWAGRDNGDSVDWNGARRYCEALEHGGASDWRLPDIDELQTLYRAVESRRAESLRCSPREREDYDFFSRWKPVPGVRASCDRFWAATRDGEGEAWSVSFSVGTAVAFRLDRVFYMRALCVRRPDG